jgi:hypothetical protein
MRRLGVPNGRSGSRAVSQRFAGALNLNIRCHTVVRWTTTQSDNLMYRRHSDDRQDAWPRGAALDPGARHRGDRMNFFHGDWWRLPRQSGFEVEDLTGGRKKGQCT